MQSTKSAAVRPFFKASGVEGIPTYLVNDGVVVCGFGFETDAAVGGAGPGTL
jgi:hypothetical protein